jgi:hypothetical protein
MQNMQNQKKTSKSSKRTVSLKIYLLSILMVCVVAVGGIWYVRTSSENSGVYPGAPSYTIWTDGAGDYFAKDAYGNLAFSGKNASYVIESAIYALPHVLVSLPFGNNPTIHAPSGTIYFTAQQFNITNRILIPLGSRLTLIGQGTSFQTPGTGLNGGTQIISSDPKGCLYALDYGTLTNGTYVSSVTGSNLDIEHMEFYQKAALANASAYAVNLSGGSQGILDDVVVTTYLSFGNQMPGYGIQINNYAYGGCWQWNQVQISGFVIDLQDYADILEVNQLELDVSDEAMVIWVTPYQTFNDVHFYWVENCLTVAGGQDILAMNGVFIESYYCNYVYYAWWANPTLFGGKVILSDVECDYLAGTNYNKVWSMYTSKAFEFRDVITDQTNGVPAFPAPVTPVLSSGTTYQNTFSQMVDVSITNMGGTITSIVINGVSMGCGNGGNYILYGGDNITVTYTGTTNWNWQGLVDNDQTIEIG